MRLLVVFVAALLSVATPPARAWGNKEHIQLTRIAARRLIADPATPDAMKAWLKQANPGILTADQERDYFLTARVGPFPRGVDGLPYFATVPDAMAILAFATVPDEKAFLGEKERKVEPFGVGERSLHYVDLELFMPKEPQRRYRHDLSGKPPLSAFDARPDKDKPPIGENFKDDRWKKAGMLPFRVHQCYAQLVKSFRDKRLIDKPGQYPRDEHAAKWAGYLAHYLEDNTQPHHATEDYRSRTYFADKRNAPDVQWDFGGRLSDDEEADYSEIRKQFWPAFERALDYVEDPIETDDVRRATIEAALISYDALPLIGTAAMKAYGQKGTPDKPEGGIGKFDAKAFFGTKGTYQGREQTLLEMRAHQMAWAVKRVERVWRQAWDEASQPVELP
jgi:hypothetical protein